MSKICYHFRKYCLCRLLLQITAECCSNLRKLLKIVPRYLKLSKIFTGDSLNIIGTVGWVSFSLHVIYFTDIQLEATLITLLHKVVKNSSILDLSILQHIDYNSVICILQEVFVFKKTLLPSFMYKTYNKFNKKIYLCTTLCWFIQIKFIEVGHNNVRKFRFSYYSVQYIPSMQGLKWPVCWCACLNVCVPLSLPPSTVRWQSVHIFQQLTS